MPNIRPARTSIERQASTRARDVRDLLAAEIRSARESAGLSQRRLASAAGVSHSTLRGIELRTHDPTTEAVARLSTALGLRLSVKLYAGSGPLVRDHIQAAMIEALIGLLDERWQPTLEVPLTIPVRGFIDLVLEGPEPPLIACEAHSELRSLEQQLRWTAAKADALAEAREKEVSRLLLLRSSRSTRATVALYPGTLTAAYPARTKDVIAAVTGSGVWPGAGMLWCSVESGRAVILDHPPRGIRVGR